MAPKNRIRISKDVNLNDDQEQEDPPTASKKDRLPGASNQTGIWKERARGAKSKGISKAREDPPTSSSDDTTMKRRHSCSHPSSSLGVCDVFEKLRPEICGVPFEITQRWLGRISTEDVLWVWPCRGNLCPTLSLLEYFPS